MTTAQSVPSRHSRNSFVSTCHITSPKPISPRPRSPDDSAGHRGAYNTRCNEQALRSRRSFDLSDWRGPEPSFTTPPRTQCRLRRSAETTGSPARAHSPPHSMNTSVAPRASHGETKACSTLNQRREHSPDESVATTPPIDPQHNRDRCEVPNPHREVEASPTAPKRSTPPSPGGVKRSLSAPRARAAPRCQPIDGADLTVGASGLVVAARVTHRWSRPGSRPGELSWSGCAPRPRRRSGRDLGRSPTP